MTVRFVELKQTPHGAASDVATIAGTWLGVAIRSLLFFVLLVVVVIGAIIGLGSVGAAQLWKRAKP